MKPPIITHQKLIFSILFFLLIARLLSFQIQIWLSNIVSLDLNWFNYCFNAIKYILLALVILFEKDNLKELHVDKTFIQLFIFAGILMVLFYLPIQIGIFIGITAFIIFYTFSTGGFSFEFPRFNYPLLIGLFLVGVVVMFGPYVIVSTLAHQAIPWAKMQISDTLWRASMPDAAYEEMLFRGILWMCLSNLKLGERKILFIQAFFFWVSHYYYFPKTYIFWVALPVLSLLLGIMVQKSKSLTPSTIFHFVMNILILS